MKRFRKQKGFTLVELLVVIAIMGILAAVVVPNLTGFTGKGRAEAKSTELQSMQTAVRAMMVDGEATVLPMAYTDVNELAEVQAVKVLGADGTEYCLEDYLNGSYPMERSYDIAASGVVTVD